MSNYEVKKYLPKITIKESDLVIDPPLPATSAAYSHAAKQLEQAIMRSMNMPGMFIGRSSSSNYSSSRIGRNTVR